MLTGEDGGVGCSAGMRDKLARKSALDAYDVTDPQMDVSAVMNFSDETKDDSRVSHGYTGEIPAVACTPDLSRL